MSRYPIALALVAALAMTQGSRAQDGSEARSKAGQGQEQGKMQTIRGQIAGVTVVGETVVDHESNRAAVAEFSYLTVLGSPTGMQGAHGAGHADSSKTEADTGNRGGKTGDEGQKSGSDASSGNRRPNVYLIALSPQTQVCEAKAQDSGASASDGKSGHDGHATSSFDRLELGDRVEIEVKDLHAFGQSPQMTKHGRNRTFRAVASSITILPGDGGGKEGARSDAKDSEQPAASKDKESEKKDSNQDK